MLLGFINPLDFGAEVQRVQEEGWGRGQSAIVFDFAIVLSILSGVGVIAPLSDSLSTAVPSFLALVIKNSLSTRSLFLTSCFFLFPSVASFSSRAYFCEGPAGSGDLSNEEALTNSPKISQSSSVKSASLSLRSRNSSAELVLGGAEEKEGLILSSSIRDREKNRSESAGISNSAAEEKNSENTGSNMKVGPAGTEEARATGVRAVEKIRIQEKAEAEEETKKDSGRFISMKLLYI